MYVKFKKDHPAGIDKGACRKVDQRVGENFIKDKYAEEITDKDYAAYKEELAADQKKASDERMEAAEETNGERHEGNVAPPVDETTDETTEDELGNEDASSNGSEDSNDGEKKYHVLNEIDINDNPELTEGLEIGMEVEIDAEDNFVVVDTKLVVKPTE